TTVRALRKLREHSHYTPSILLCKTSVIIMPLPAASEAGKHPKTARSRVAPPKAAASCLNLLWLPPSALRGHGRICPATIRFLPCFTATLHGMHAWTTLDDP